MPEREAAPTGAEPPVVTAEKRYHVSREALIVAVIGALATLAAAVIGVVATSGPDAPRAGVGVALTADNRLVSSDATVTLSHVTFTATSVVVTGTASGVPDGEHVYVGAQVGAAPSATSSGQSAAAAMAPASWLVARATPDAGGRPAAVQWAASIRLSTAELAAGVSVTAFRSVPILSDSGPDCVAIGACSMSIHPRTISDARLATLPHTPSARFTP